MNKLLEVLKNENPFEEFKNLFHISETSRYKINDDSLQFVFEYLKKEFLSKTFWNRDLKNPVLYIYNEDEGLYREHNDLKVFDLYLQNVFPANSFWANKSTNYIIEKFSNDLELKTIDEFFLNLKQMNPFLIPFENCIYDLKNNKTINYSKDFYFTNKFKYSYNSKLNNEDIKNFLYEVLNEGDVETLREFIGMSFLGDYRFQKLLYLRGGGRNGKGVLTDIIKNIFSGFHSSLSAQQINKNKDNFELKDLFNKRVNLGGEAPKNLFFEDENIKKLTGQDEITAQIKHSNKSLTFENTAKFIFSSNDYPLIKGDSKAIFERLIFIEFPYTFVDAFKYDETNPLLKIKDINLKDKLNKKESIESFIYWVLEGALNLIERNSFSPNYSNENLKDKLEEKTSPIKYFLKNNIEFNNGFLSVEELKEEIYSQTKIKPSVQKLSSLISDLFGVEKIYSSKIRIINNIEKRPYGWEGLKIKNNLEVFENE